jgi:2,3-bisphosphoglycerate-independent phosphoglycerate mutase
MTILLLFLDGIGLGENDPDINPFVRADMPVLRALLGGNPLIRESAPYVGERASLAALDAGLGVAGLPQSATGQAVLLTGVNIPKNLGYHYGPKPNRQIAQVLNGETLFSKLVHAGKKAALLNAYPPRYFHGIETGKRLYSSIPLAVTNAGLPLFTKDNFYSGRALSADFTGRGWRSMLHFHDSPLTDTRSAGRKLASLAREYDFALFEYWASDYAGHKQDMAQAVELMESFDGVLSGLVEDWRDEDGLILLTSDHGNMENLSTRRHTDALVPALIIGYISARNDFTNGLKDITGIAPAIWRTMKGSK